MTNRAFDHGLLQEAMLGLPRKNSTVYKVGHIRSFGGVNHRCVFPGASGLVEPVITSPVDAPELITNGGFDTDTVWTKGAGWSIGSGTANMPIAQGSNSNISQTIVPATTHLVSYDLVVLTGNFQAYSGGGGAGVIRNVSGHYEELIDHGIGVLAYMFALTGATGSVDNLSFREVVKDGTCAWETLK